MEQVVIYGNGQVAGLAHYYLTHDSDYEVAAFTVDRHFLRAETFQGLRVLALDMLPEYFPPASVKAFVAMGYGKVNRDREERYRQMKEMGYSLISYVSSKAIVWPDVVIGENCFIMEGNILQPSVRIGNNVVMFSACHIGHETVVKDHCFLAAHAVVSGNVTIEPNCFVGINASIRNAITLAQGCVIGAGAVILKDTKERGVYLSPRVELLAATSDRLPGL